MITNTAIQQTTSHKVVIPFYVYAALGFFIACVMLFLYAGAFGQHHFNPQILAITHTMALGWGTMIILGASYQLVPVLVENKLYSNSLAYLSFALAGVGIPLLVYGFLVFDMGWPSRLGGILVNLAVIGYGLNLVMSMQHGKMKNIHALFIFTAAIWLLLTTLLGLLLVYNFKTPFLAAHSLRYLSLHAHMGVAGWFLMLVLGVGSRLIPMFMISKYNSPFKLWIIYIAVNLGLLLYVVFDLLASQTVYLLIPAVLIGLGIVVFVSFCYEAYRKRIRKQLDRPMQISLMAIVIMLLPLFLIGTVIIVTHYFSGNNQMAVLYGFFIFFGWLTAIILGMTFKTLPFIVWNKVYHQQARKGKTPSPKELFSDNIFHWMAWSYMLGFVGFTTGLVLDHLVILQTSALILILTAFLYNFNVIRTVFHKPVQS